MEQLYQLEVTGLTSEDRNALTALTGLHIGTDRFRFDGINRGQAAALVACLEMLGALHTESGRE